MRQIGDVTARTAHNFGAVGDEAVELAGQRCNLSGKRALETARTPFANPGKPLADAAKRHQAEMDLEGYGNKQADAECCEPPEQSPVEARHIRFHLALIARDREAQRSRLFDSLRRSRQRDAANENPQILTIGTGGIAPTRVVRAGRETFGNELLIPKRARGLRLGVYGLGHIRLDLPIPAGEHALESRIGETSLQ